MKISIHTTITNPDYWQYAWKESIDSFLAMADEVIIVCGCREDLRLIMENYSDEYNDKRIKLEYLHWPYDFSWEEIAKHFNIGLKSCTGDWAIKCDLDYVFHEKDIDEFKLQLSKYENMPVCSMVKFNVLHKYIGYQKVHSAFIVNKKLMGDKIKYGVSTTEDTAWGYPIMVEGIDEKTELPIGRSFMDNEIGRIGIDFWNYDNFFKTIERTKEHFLRFSIARNKAGFGYTWGKTGDEALEKFCDMMKSRIKKTKGINKPLTIDSHPKYIRETIKNMKPEQFGYNNWNGFKEVL